MRVTLIANTQAGAFRPNLLVRAEESFRAHGAELRVCRCEAPGDSRRAAETAVESNADLVAVAGGDGTINEVINTVACSPVALSVLPMGSVNVLAKEIGLSGPVEKAVDTAVHGARTKIALGKAGDRYFVLMASVGFDAEVVYNISLTWKDRIGTLIYPATALKLLGRTPMPSLCVRHGTEEFPARGVIISKARFYGGALTLAPDADLTVPDLDVCVFSRGKAIDIVRYSLALLRGRHLDLDDVKAFKATELEIVAHDGHDMHVQADGDVIGRLPMRFGVAPEALTLVMPQEKRNSPCESAS